MFDVTCVGKAVVEERFHTLSLKTPKGIFIVVCLLEAVILLSKLHLRYPPASGSCSTWKCGSVLFLLARYNIWGCMWQLVYSRMHMFILNQFLFSKNFHKDSTKNAKGVRINCDVHLVLEQCSFRKE